MRACFFSFFAGNCHGYATTLHGLIRHSSPWRLACEVFTQHAPHRFSIIIILLYIYHIITASAVYPLQIRFGATNDYLLEQLL